MFCSKCGEQIDDTANFCRRCGARMTGTDFSEINVKLQNARKVINCTCAECKYSGNMKFVKYKWNLFQRYMPMIIIAIIIDRILPGILPFWFIFLMGIIFINVWLYITSLPKYMECPNCGKILYQSTPEKVIDNPIYVKPVKSE